MKIVFDKKEMEAIKKLAITMGVKPNEIKDRDGSNFKAGYVHMDIEKGILMKFHTGFIISAIDLFERKIVPVINMFKGIVDLLGKDSELKSFTKQWFDNTPKKEEVIYYKLPSCHGRDIIECTKFMDCDFAKECMVKFKSNRNKRSTGIVVKRNVSNTKHSEVAVDKVYEDSLPNCFGKFDIKYIGCVNCILGKKCKSRLTDSEAIKRR